MKKLLIGVAALPFLASIAMAGQPTTLNDTNMDMVTAGDQSLPGFTVHSSDFYGTPTAIGPGGTPGGNVPGPLQPWTLAAWGQGIGWYGPAPTILTGAAATGPCAAAGAGCYHFSP